MRGILPLDEFHIPRSLRKTMKRGDYAVTFNQAFDDVIQACAEPAPGRENTWINGAIVQLYSELRALNHAHSVEVWHDQQLVGGLYGVSLGRAFFGESMFSRQTDASKIGLVHFVDHLKERGFVLLDTQFITEHLKRFGAVEIPQESYLKLLELALIGEATFE